MEDESTIWAYVSSKSQFSILLGFPSLSSQEFHVNETETSHTHVGTIDE